MNELHANNSTAVKYCLSIVQSNIIDTNDITKNTTTEDSILNIDTSSVLRCTDSISFANEFNDKDIVTECSKRDKDKDDDLPTMRMICQLVSFQSRYNSTVLLIHQQVITQNISMVTLKKN